MDREDFELKTGWRPVFSQFPATKNTAQKLIMPTGYFYSPFLAQAPDLKKGKLPLCSKCTAAINPHSRKENNQGIWQCNFCQTDNPLLKGFGNNMMEEYYEMKVGDCGLYFIVDVCLSEEELNSVKETLITTIKKLPKDIFVGLMIFNENVLICNFEGPEVEYVCVNGSQSYPTMKDVAEALGSTLGNVANFHPKSLLNKFYVPIAPNLEKLLEVISELEPDSHVVLRENREQRATGAALQLAVNAFSQTGISTRFVSIIGGPCTIGPGKVVDIPLKTTIRVYMDIFEGNENAGHMKAAKKFYDELSNTIINNKCTMDMWAYGLDQFGLLEMKEMVNQSGGLLAMHEQFNHFIFQQSFERFYEPNEVGLFNFPFACNLRIRVSKELKINGILGTCRSLRDNALKTASDMEIGEGMTNSWYLGGICTNNALCVMLTNSDLATSENKEKGAFIQAVTTYKYSDNIIRTRVSTIYVAFIRDVQLKDILRGFDQNASAVMLARMAARKAEVEDYTEVKKWVDRVLLKFTVRFAIYNRNQRNSFRLPPQMKHFPQFMYHLRRSGFINPFGSPPDQSIYMKTCLIRESIENCMVMIQSALLKYSTEAINEEGKIEPQAVELDFQEMKDDAVLLMDSYFNVIVWFGEHIQGWKEDKMNEDPEYEYLTELFEAPVRDASEIIYDRLPVSNFYETFKNDGKERYLKARVNPSTSSQVETDGHFISDDAPINLFMDFLVKSVVSYNE